MHDLSKLKAEQVNGQEYKRHQKAKQTAQQCSQILNKGKSYSLSEQCERCP